MTDDVEAALERRHAPRGAEGSNWAWVEIMGDRRNNARPVIVSSLIEAGIVSLAMALERRAVRGDAVP